MVDKFGFALRYEPDVGELVWVCSAFLLTRRQCMATVLEVHKDNALVYPWTGRANGSLLISLMRLEPVTEDIGG